MSADWKATATGSYLLLAEKLTGLGIRFAESRWIVETYPVTEPPIEPQLVVTKEWWGPAIGRWRNRLLVEAKEKTLPKLLATKKTHELVDFATKLEKTTLDLTHERELAKDEAQALVEKNQPADKEGRSPDVLRELAHVYEERIEVLKAILAAVRDEITNRSR